MKEAVLSAADEVIPVEKRRARIPWFTETVFEKILNKAEKFSLYRDARANKAKTAEEVLQYKEDYRKAKNEAKAACSKSRKQMWDLLAQELEAEMKVGHEYEAFRSLRNFVRRKNKIANSQIRDANGRLLTTVHDKLERWRRFFCELLHTPDPEADCKADTSEPPPGREVCHEPPDEPPPTLADVRAALSRLKSRKAAGPDGITSELLKHGGPTFERKFHELVQQVWETERAPQDWKGALLVTLYKKKGDMANGCFFKKSYSFSRKVYHFEPHRYGRL